MRIRFPLTPDVIQENIIETVDTIHKETKWKIQRDPSKIKISFDNAPEFGLNFGTIRKKNELSFANWLLEFSPKTTRSRFFEYLIIRESISFFFSEDLLFGQISDLVSLFLNLIAVAYVINNYDNKYEPEMRRVKSRFIFVDEEPSDYSQFKRMIDSLVLSIFTQKLSYTLIQRTFLFFIQDLPLEQIDTSEIVEDISRYLATSQPEQASPIIFRKKIKKAFEKLIELGHECNSIQLAEALDIDQATAYRQMAKIGTRYHVNWYKEVHWGKLGLNTYLILIEFSKENPKIRDSIATELLEIKYLYELFDGENKESLFLYSVIHCPEAITIKLDRKLRKYLSNFQIKSFKINEITRRVYRTNLVDSNFKSTTENYKLLLNGQMNSKKIILYDTLDVKLSERVYLEENDEILLHFLSVLLYKSIYVRGFWSVHFKHLESLLNRRNIDINDTPAAQSLFNNLQNTCLEKGILDFKLLISATLISNQNKLVLEMPLKQEKKTIEKLINELSVFGLIVLLHSKDRIFLVITGIKFSDELVDMIESKIMKTLGEAKIFSIRSRISRYIPYHKLFDFTSNIWFL